MATLASTRRTFLPVHRLVQGLKPLPHRHSFHASSHPRFLDTCFGIVHASLASMHSTTGLPWVATIPCFALAVRAFVLSPFLIYLHRLNSRRAKLRPMALAWAHLIRKHVRKEYAAEGPDFCQKHMERQYRKKMTEIHRRHGTQLWKNLISLGQFPIFLIIVETVRKMCGAHKGLLGLMMPGASDENQSMEAIPLDQVIAQDQGTELFLFEESLGNEGALWFPDLLVPDPMMILPFALMGTLFLNINYHTSRNDGAPVSKWSRRFTRGLKILALASGPLTLQVPSAMLLYWVSSSLCGLGQLVLMERYFPLTTTVKACKSGQKRFLLGARPGN